MDPNVCLAELRDLGKFTIKAKETGVDDFVRVLELFEALDGWLSSGGFLPKDWREAKDAVSNLRQL